MEEENLERNLKQIVKARREGIGIPISGAGGIYSGVDILNYLKAGTDNVQVFSLIYVYLLEKKYGIDKAFKKALIELMLNPTRGFIPAFLELKNKTGIKSVKELVETSKQEPLLKI